MNPENLCLTYDYSPYRSQKGEEIPAFEIFDQEGQKLADTNEDMDAVLQEAIASLFVASPEFLKVLKSAGRFDWVHNTAHTNDIEALRRICLQYSKWWNEEALPVIAAW